MDGWQLYEAQARCLNCGFEGRHTFPLGTPVDAGTCPVCQVPNRMRAPGIEEERALREGADR